MLGEAIKKLIETGVTFRLEMELRYGDRVVYEKQRVYHIDYAELAYNDPEAFNRLNPPYEEMVKEAYEETRHGRGMNGEIDTWWEEDVERREEIKPEKIEEFIKEESKGKVYGIGLSISKGHRMVRREKDKEFKIENKMSISNAEKWIKLHTDIALE